MIERISSEYPNLVSALAGRPRQGPRMDLAFELAEVLLWALAFLQAVRILLG